jgi:peroxiredoxin
VTLPGVGDPAPDVVLRDATGGEITLSSFWRDRPVVAVFLRHWG